MILRILDGIFADFARVNGEALLTAIRMMASN
jgi:hypothetical protein